MPPELEARVGNRTRRLMEMTMAVAILSLGVQLTNTPANVFADGGPLSPLRFLPPLAWTLAYIIMGSSRLAIVIINGVWPLSPTVRWWMSLICIAFVWAPLSSGYWLMLPTTQGYPSLILGPIAFIVEANCLFALSALRAGRRRDA